jgi:hypothetical protein
MIVFQQQPCRLYPKINRLIAKQFPDSFWIHEVFSFKSDIQRKNPLEITQNNFTLPRYNFIYGIFDEKKIKRKDKDFWFTIEIPKEKILQEFFCAVKHYGSFKFGYVNSKDVYESYLHKLLRPLYKLTLKELSYYYYKNEIDDIINDEVYNLRFNFTNSKNFDYVGDFDNWGKTITDIKKIVGLDLSTLSAETPYSYKK